LNRIQQFDFIVINTPSFAFQVSITSVILSQKIHRRYTQDTQIDLSEYGVGTAQTQTKAMCHKIRKADIPMEWASIPYPAHAGLENK
jgi:hypothetical protein